MIRQLYKSFGGLQVLNDLHLELSRGERLFILGPSGCGKTTLLRIICGLEKPEGGEMRLEAMRIGYVFQEPRLIPWCSVKKNLMFVDEEGDYKGILSELGLGGFEDYLPCQLSEGMKQRVNLARALIVHPDLLLLDEPFTALDLRVKKQIIEDLERLWRERGFTMIAVSHDPKEALALADRIVILSPRPAQVSGEFEVKLGRERDLSAPALIRMEAKLIDLICNAEIIG